MVRWIVVVDPLSYFSFQPVLHDWCNKGRGVCYPVCEMVHIKEPFLLNVLSASLNKTFPSLRIFRGLTNVPKQNLPQIILPVGDSLGNITPHLRLRAHYRISILKYYLGTFQNNNPVYTDNISRRVLFYKLADVVLFF